MKRVLFGFCLAALAVALMYGRDHRAGNIEIAGKALITSDNCNDRFQGSQGRFAAEARGEKTRTLANQPLNIHSEKNGAVQVTTWDGPDFSIKLCKYAATNDEAAARAIVDETKVAVEGSTVSVAAPENLEHSYLGALLLVKAPKAATVNLKVKNGGASIYKFDGTADAETTNGGITLRNSTGKLTVQAKNGGVSIRDCSGDVSATAANGGISIDLPEQWEGKPEPALPKIVTGMLNGFFKDAVLLEQASVQDTKKTVQQLLDEAGVTSLRRVIAFARAVGSERVIFCHGL